MALYRILQSTDWSFLIGAEVTQIAIGFHQVQVALFKNRVDTTISMETDFIHERSGQVLSEATSTPDRAATLVTLIGKQIENVRADGENALFISFSGSETLKIMVDDERYEDFTIDGPAGLLVV